MYVLSIAHGSLSSTGKMLQCQHDLAHHPAVSRESALSTLEQENRANAGTECRQLPLGWLTHGGMGRDQHSLAKAPWPGRPQDVPAVLQNTPSTYDGLAQTLISQY